MLKMIETIVLCLALLAAASAKSAMNKKNARMERDDESWSSGMNDWDSGEVKQITIEKKVPVFVEKIRHVPIVHKEYIPIPRYISRPVYIERSVPIIIPRSQHYHHHHFSEYHHMH